MSNNVVEKNDFQIKLKVSRKFEMPNDDKSVQYKGIFV